VASIQWLRERFVQGYDSGDILRPFRTPHVFVKKSSSWVVSGGVQKTVLPFIRPDSSCSNSDPAMILDASDFAACSRKVGWKLLIS